MNKQAIAKDVFSNMYGGAGNRSLVMAEIRHQTGCSQAYAATLYNNARKAHAGKAAVRSNSDLQKYINDINAWGKIFKIHTPLEYPTTRQDCKPLFGRLASDLSPENLCCDGELPAAQVRRKARFLNECWSALEAIFGRSVNEEETYRW